MRASRLLKKPSMAFSTSTFEKRGFQMSPIFKGLQPSKMTVHPCTVRKPSKNRVFQQPASYTEGLAMKLQGVAQQDTYLSVDIAGTTSRFRYFRLRSGSVSPRCPSSPTANQIRLPTYKERLQPRMARESRLKPLLQPLLQAAPTFRTRCHLYRSAAFHSSSVQASAADRWPVPA